MMGDSRTVQSGKPPAPTRLRNGCPQFAEWWEAHDIRGGAGGVKALATRQEGYASFAHASFQANDDPDLKLARLRRLISAGTLGGTTLVRTRGSPRLASTRAKRPVLIAGDCQLGVRANWRRGRDAPLLWSNPLFFQEIQQIRPFRGIHSGLQSGLLFVMAVHQQPIFLRWRGMASFRKFRMQIVVNTASHRTARPGRSQTSADINRLPA